MHLKKRNTQTARWDKENNKWLVGTTEYQWVHHKSKEESPWMSFDDALIWIRKHDGDSSAYSPSTETLETLETLEWPVEKNSVYQNGNLEGNNH